MTYKKNLTKKTVNIVVRKMPNVLIKIISFFEKRGFIIENINLIDTNEPDTNRYNIIIAGDGEKLGKYSKQLYKFFETIDVNFI